MRLGDLDALRKNMEFVCMGIMAGTEPYNAPLTEIDNAPTAEPEPVPERQKRALAIVDALTEKHLINVMERGCLRRSILLEPERPQGDLANEVWKLYEKYQSHLATSVIEFGDELKDLLGKYQKGGTEE